MRAARVVAVAAALVFLAATPATAGTDPTGDPDAGSTTPVAVNGASKSGGSFSVYGDQAISNYTVKAFPWIATPPQDQRVQVRTSAKKQTDGLGFVVTEIQLDTWEKGTNPATSPCNSDDGGLVDNVHGELKLRKWNSGDGWTTLRSWPLVTLCNDGDSGHETLLGGTNSVSTNAQAIGVWYDYDIKVQNGNDIQNHHTFTKRKSTGFSSWLYWCGGDNIIVCDEDG